MSFLKKLGRIITAPARGIGHALRTSHIPLLSNVGGAIEHTGNAFAGKGAFLREIGKAGQSAAPVAALIPGVGPLAAGLIGGGGAFLNKGKRTTAGQLLKYGALPAAEAALLGGQGYKGIGGAFGRAKGFLKSGAGLVGKGVKALGGPLPAAQLALGGLSTLQGAQQAGRAQDMIGRSLGGGLAPVQPPDLSGVFADPSNPFSQAPPTYQAARAAGRALAR